MTPEQAAAAIADVKEARQGLTARAAGIIWMVWGLVLAAITISGPASWLDGNGAGFDLTDVLELVFMLVVVAVGIMSTFMVWHSHALVAGHRTRFWFTAGLAVLGIVVGTIAINVFLVDLLISLEPAGAFYRTSIPTVAMMVALIITWLQRHRVAWWPGVLIAVAMLVLQVAFPFLIAGDESPVAFVRATFLEGSVVAVGFSVAGFWHFLRG